MKRNCDCCKIEMFCLQHKITKEWYCHICFSHINKVITKVFDDIDKFHKKYDWWITNSKIDAAYNELKKRHLPTTD